jgi:hypothetical protein
MLRVMIDPDGPAAIAAAGWYPDPWLASQQRYWNGEWTAWTVQPAPRKLGALDSFGVTVAFIMSLAGVVFFFAGMNPRAGDAPAAAPTDFPPVFNHPALSTVGAIAAGFGVILSVFARYHLRNTEGNRHDLLRKLAKAGVILPLAATGCLVFWAMAVAPS